MTTRECAAADPTTGSLKTTVVVLDPSDLREGDKPLFQVQIENVGANAVTVPVAAAMEPLQPDDLSKKFVYYKAVVTMWIAGKSWNANTAGTLTLYGDDDRPGTTVKLRPGEWVRISGKGNIKLPTDDPKIKALMASGEKPNRIFGETDVYRDTTTVTATTTDTTSQNMCVSQITGPSRSIVFHQ
jgi:hypothetical protein